MALVCSTANKKQGTMYPGSGLRRVIHYSYLSHLYSVELHKCYSGVMAQIGSGAKVNLMCVCVRACMCVCVSSL